MWDHTHFREQPHLLPGLTTFSVLATALIGGRGAIKMASASTPSANEPAKDLILVQTAQLKPIIKHKSQEEWYLVV